MSPDWSAKAEPVPYAKMDDPQSLNLYAYVGNNPLGGVDQDGHWSDDCGRVTVTATTSGDAPLTSSNGGKTATAEGRVQYKFTYDGKPLKNTKIHEDISNKSSRDGVPEKAKVVTNDDFTGPKNGNPSGVVPDASNISITSSYGAAEATMSNSVFSKDTTQTLSFQTPKGSSCSVTETRTLTNANSKGQSTDTYAIKLTSPVTQHATPVQPSPPQTPTP